MTVQTGGLGLTPSRFFLSIPDLELRRLIDPDILSVLDAVFGGRTDGDGLQRVANTLIDVNALLGDEKGRRLILSLIGEPKRTELEHRVGKVIDTSGAWTEREIGYAREFFGFLDENVARPPTHAVTTVEPSYGLFEHQRSAVQSLATLLFRDERRAVLHLPTGVGKTRTAMHVVAESLRTNYPSIVVWLASSRELLEQAVLSFQEAWEHLGERHVQLGSMWGDRTPDLDNFTDGFLAVGLAKGWALKSRTDPKWATRISSRVRLVVFDEAHQSIAKTYRSLTEDLALDYRCALLGLTATPGRTWDDIDKDGELAEFYSWNKVGLEVPGDNPIDHLIAHGYLARPLFRTMFAEPGINLNDRELARIARSLDIPADIVDSFSLSTQYVVAVLSAIEQLLLNGHERVLVFAASVRHAVTLAAILVTRSIHAAVVTGTTPERTRDRAIKAFKSVDKDPMVLINFGVLTTGFDAPSASGVVIARPTKSLVLYSQMVGRGIRGPKAGGTDNCEIVTVVDPSLPGFGDVAAAFHNWEDVWL